MDELEWDRLDAQKRSDALWLAGTPSHWEGDERVDYELLEWASLPLHVRHALVRLPANWQKPPPGPVH
jgi:hypothetical protein